MYFTCHEPSDNGNKMANGEAIQPLDDGPSMGGMFTQTSAGNQCSSGASRGVRMSLSGSSRSVKFWTCCPGE